MEGYSAKVVFANKELTAREKIKIKDLSNAVLFDEVVTDEIPLMISPEIWCEVDIHNEKGTEKDYKKYVVVDKSGTKYTTGSESFWSALNSIGKELAECDDDSDFSIEVYRRPSKNYSGKTFLTCSLQ